MFKNQFRLGKAFGIPLRIDASWLLIFVWVTWSLARGYFPSQYPAWSSTLTWVLAIVTSLLFFGSVLLHELGHALVARANGTPVHDITLFIFGGVAQISDEPETPGKGFAMAASGPMVSLALSAIFAILYLITRRAVEPLAALGFYLGVINLNLGVFNLIPGFPLDGGRVLRAILWSARRDLLWATRWASRSGQLIAYLFIVGGIVLAFSGNWVSGIWLAFIGLFLDNAARSAYQQTSLRQVLSGHYAEEIMSRDCYMLPPQVTLDVLVDQHLLGSGRRCFTVGVDGEVQGLISVHSVGNVPKEEWPFTRVSDVLTPLDRVQKVAPETPLWDVLQQMTTDGVNQLPVVEHGTLVGMVTRENLVTFIRDQAAWDVMNYRERIMAAVEQRPLDRFPTDIWCVEEVRRRLLDYCGTTEWVRVLDALEIDAIIGLTPPYIGPKLPELGKGVRQDEWGMVYRQQEYATGVYWEQVGYPLAEAQTLDDLAAYPWPDPDWYDYSALPDLCAQYGDRAIQIGYTAVFYFHNKLRGLELSMMDLAWRPEFSHELIRRLANFFHEYHDRCYAAAGKAMQITQVTDDFGSQTGLLISKRMFETYYRPWIQRAINLAKGYGLKVFHHDDGAIYSLIPTLIEMGVDILNPIQWRCKGMDREAIGANFAGKLCFHGGVDNQETLPFATADDVRAEVADNLRLLGRTGTGYIIAPCHNIQANTSLENILAMYQAPRTV